ncbi:unnamed protein product [Larinioides sclopetarius]|uniref:Uncharacterized protein n=1 Tax=Larinioides sclopetarius TaxID=280406 RepID=A0AAV1Z0U0_9ARAC
MNFSTFRSSSHHSTKLLSALKKEKIHCVLMYESDFAPKSFYMRVLLN